eukprot:1161641-Pelagomonas_calceolata.AAC.5
MFHTSGNTFQGKHDIWLKCMRAKTKRACLLVLLVVALAAAAPAAAPVGQLLAPELQVPSKKVQKSPVRLLLRQLWHLQTHQLGVAAAAAAGHLKPGKERLVQGLNERLSLQRRQAGILFGPPVHAWGVNMRLSGWVDDLRMDHAQVPCVASMADWHNPKSTPKLRRPLFLASSQL